MKLNDLWEEGQSQGLSFFSCFQGEKERPSRKGKARVMYNYELKQTVTRMGNEYWSTRCGKKVKAGKEIRLDNSIAFDFVKVGDGIKMLGGEITSNKGDGVRMFLESGDEWALQLYFPELLEELVKATKPKKGRKKKVA